MAFPFGGIVSRLFAPRRRAFEAAGTGRRAPRSMLSPASAVLAARRPILHRARWAYANNAFARAGVEALNSAEVGTGLRPQPAHPDPAARGLLQPVWERWTDVADEDRLGDFYAMTATINRRLTIDGEAIVLIRHGEDGSPRLKLLDAEQLDGSLTRDLAGGAKIVQGVEFDAADRRVAYHILADRPGLGLAGIRPAVRVLAQDILHVFIPEFPGQVRGISRFAPVLLRLYDLDGVVDAQVMRQRLAAALMGVVITPATDGGPFAAEASAATDGLSGGIEPGTIKALRPGEDIRWSEPARIGAESIDFLRFTAREIAAGLGVPYEVLTGDLSQVNYSSIRAGLLEFRRRVEVHQHNVLVFQALRPIWRRFVTAEILSGRIAAPDFGRNPEAWLGARWITPRFDWVDPRKDVEAELAAIDGGLMSRRQAVAARGYDLEALDQEIADDNARAARLGLSFGTGAAAAKETEGETA